MNSKVADVFLEVGFIAICSKFEDVPKVVNAIIDWGAVRKNICFSLPPT